MKTPEQIRTLREKEYRAYFQRLEKHYNRIVGGKIVCYEPFSEDGDVYPQFCIQMPDGTKLWFSLTSDEEGNGPGFGFIEKDD